jgi:hypothetical protein
MERISSFFLMGMHREAEYPSSTRKKCAKKILGFDFFLFYSSIMMQKRRQNELNQFSDDVRADKNVNLPFR